MSGISDNVATMIINQTELLNNDLSILSAYRDTYNTVKELQIAIKMGEVAFKIAKDVAGNVFVVLADTGSSVNDVTSVSYIPSTVQGAMFVTVGGIAGGVVCTAGDLLTLYKRGKELHELEKELANVKKNREHSFTHRFLQKKVNVQRCLVASSVIAVASDAVVLGTTIACTGGLGSGLGSTAIAAIRMAGEDHLNDSFMDDLYEFVNEYETANLSVKTDPMFGKTLENTFHKVKHQYENAKTEKGKADKALKDIKDKIAQADERIEQAKKNPELITLSFLDYRKSLSSDQEEARKALDTADAALKHVEQGYKSWHNHHEDFESYKACIDLITGLTGLRKRRDHLKSQIKAFENTYQKEFGPFKEVYKKTHFLEVNPDWQKRMDFLNKKLEDDMHLAKIELRQTETSFVAAYKKEYKKIKSKMDSAQSTIMNNDPRNMATGGACDESAVRAAEKNKQTLRPHLEKARAEYFEQLDKVRGIKEKIKTITEKQKAFKEYANNLKNLSEVREKIVVKNRGLENTKTIKSADKTLEEQSSLKVLMSESNYRKLQEHLQLPKSTHLQLQKSTHLQLQKSTPVSISDEDESLFTTNPTQVSPRLDSQKISLHNPNSAEFTKNLLVTLGNHPHSKEENFKKNHHLNNIDTHQKSVVTGNTPTAKNSTATDTGSVTSRGFQDYSNDLNNIIPLDASQNAHEQFIYIKKNQPQIFESMKQIVQNDKESLSYFNNIDSMSNSFVLPEHINNLKKFSGDFQKLTRSDITSTAKENSPVSPGTSKAEVSPGKGQFLVV